MSAKSDALAERKRVAEFERKVVEVVGKLSGSRLVGRFELVRYCGEQATREGEIRFCMARIKSSSNVTIYMTILELERRFDPAIVREAEKRLNP